MTNKQPPFEINERIMADVIEIAELEGSGFKIIREGIIFYKEEVKHWKAV